METFLQLLSGIAWSIVYIECIRKGFKDKTYAMPLYALGLNIAWETIYTIHDLSTKIELQAFVNLAWMCLDAVIVYTYFKFGRKEFPENGRKYFVPFSILSFVVCVMFQFAFFLSFDALPAAQYSAFAQNAAMSIMFVIMLFRRNSTKGQSLTIAIAKWIGTLAPTLLMTVVWDFSPYIFIMGVICSIFDILYIVLLWKFRKAR
ncbi:MAG: hypothetical protein IJ833_10580 [Lachnospiraceae bacterium]|nr:hypothetical protein [Lachnospiraceae bacterium]